MSERPTRIVEQVRDTNLDLLEVVRKCRENIISMTGDHRRRWASLNALAEPIALRRRPAALGR